MIFEVCNYGAIAGNYLTCNYTGGQFQHWNRWWEQRFENDSDEGGLADAVTMMVELSEEDSVPSDLPEEILKSLQELTMRRRGNAPRN